MFKRSIVIGLAIFCLSTSTLGFELNEILITPKRNSDTKIENYSAVWSQLVTEPDGTKRKGINTISDDVEIRELPDGRKVIQRSVKWLDTNNNWYTKKDILDHQTLKPISIDIRWNPDYVQHTDIFGKTLSSTSVKDAFSKTRVTLTELKDIGYSWSSDGFVLNVVSGINERKFSLQTLDNLPHAPTIGKKEFEFTGKERIEIDGVGEFETKVFETKDGGNTDATYWLSNSKPYIMKVRFKRANGQITVLKLDSFTAK